MSELKEKVKAAAQKPAVDAADCPPEAHVADRRLPDPKVVKLVKRLGPDGRPEDRPPEPPVAAADGPLPRLVHQNERAPTGVARYKVSARNHNPRPVRYILARSEAEARRLYVESTGLDAHIRKLEAESEAELERDLRVLRLRAIHAPNLADAAERLAAELETIRVTRAVPPAELVVTRLPD